jgi:hypothetical protein
MSALTPSILDVPVDLARNRSWTGSKIKPDWNPSAPESIKYFDNLRNKLTGRKFIEGTRYLGENGIEISPADLNYALESYVGGAGRFASKSLTTLFNPKEDRNTQEVPFVGRFYRDIPEQNLRDESEEFKKIKKILQKQDKNTFYLNQEAEIINDGLKLLPPDEANKRFKEIKKENSILADKIYNIKKEEDLNYSYSERLINRLGVANGERANYIHNKAKTMTPDEANIYIKELRDKKIITDSVMKQIIMLIKEK